MKYILNKKILYLKYILYSYIKMSLVKTVIVCGTTIVLFDFYKNNPNNKYVKLTNLHIRKSIELCPFLRSWLK